MAVESASSSPSTATQIGRLRGVVLAASLACLPTRAAVAQSSVTGSSGRASTNIPRSELIQVFDRLDPLAIGLIVAALAILTLLIWRVWMMVRREQPVVVPARQRARRPNGDDALDRATIQGKTDWGFDQNKRAALVRSPVIVDNTKVDLPSLERAVTQWSVSEVQNAAAISMQANEGLGKSPHMPPSPYRTSFNPYFTGEQPAHAMEVIEVADTLLQAELLVQLGDPKQAMTLLSQHIRETEKPGPAVWLMLLNLYQATGRRAQYDALATGFGTLFNAAVPPWATSTEVMARDLESYPQVMLKLHTSWPKPAVRPFIEGLLNDDRGGSRQGFSLKAYRDILFLLEILDALDQMTREDEEREEVQRKLGTVG